MKQIFILANWKSNKLITEARDWLSQIAENKEKIENNKTVILFPPVVYLPVIKYEIGRLGLPILLGAQNVSPFPEGAYTGEVNGAQIKEFADYVLIGHSERRKNFNESDELLSQKTAVAKQTGLKTAFCVQDSSIIIPEGVDIVAYEPIGAIGTGNPDTPESADETAKSIKAKNQNIEFVLYGGSVSIENVAAFTKMENIDGVLVGGASLDSSEFIQIINNA